MEEGGCREGTWMTERGRQGTGEEGKRREGTLQIFLRIAYAIIGQS